MIKIIEHEHDVGYKKVFSKKRNFLHFIRKYIQVDWVNNIDENDLILIDKSFVEADYKDKESDIIYKIKFQDSEIIFYVLLELQSTVDRTMPFRLLKYMVELMKREFDNTPENERKLTDYRLPAVVPIILYNGSDNWTAVRNFKEYLQGYEKFGDYIIDFKYLLFDLNRTTEETILSTNQLLDMIFALDQNPNRKNMERMLTIAFENLDNMSDDDKTDILGWIKYIYLNYIPNEDTKTEILHKFEKGEITSMMYGIDRYINEELEKGRKELENDRKELENDRKEVEKRAEKRAEKRTEKKAEKKAHKEKIESVKNLIEIGLSDSQISKAMKMEISEIETLRKGK